MSRRVVVAGASGMIGSALVEALRHRGDDVAVLARTHPPGAGAVWNPDTGSLDPAVVSGADAVVCLNGAPIGDKRWTPERKELLRTSRVGPVSVLATAIATAEDTPRVFISGSATGYYGNTGDRLVDESDAPGDDFLARLCIDWEAAAGPALESGVRVAHARTGIVLSRRGGALSPLLPIFKAGLGGPIAGGTQWWSWITLADEVSALLFLIDREISGPVNLVAPEPVRQKDFASALGSALHRPAVVPAPKVAVQARLGRELAAAIGFASQRVSPTVLADAGFEFAHSDVRSALTSMFT